MKLVHQFILRENFRDYKDPRPLANYVSGYRTVGGIRLECTTTHWKQLGNLLEKAAEHGCKMVVEK